MQQENVPVYLFPWQSEVFCTDAESFQNRAFVGSVTAKPGEDGADVHPLCKCLWSCFFKQIQVHIE